MEPTTNTTSKLLITTWLMINKRLGLLWAQRMQPNFKRKVIQPVTQLIKMILSVIFTSTMPTSLDWKARHSQLVSHSKMEHQVSMITNQSMMKTLTDWPLCSMNLHASQQSAMLKSTFESISFNPIIFVLFD